ncbi:hypothetical protein [Borborobacter arsenicus]|nr:hypothetical protein [Pseudaminobacter arsenicus]
MLRTAFSAPYLAPEDLALLARVLAKVQRMNVPLWTATPQPPL